MYSDAESLTPEGHHGGRLGGWGALGNHTWASVSTLPPVWNSYPGAWLGVSLRDTGLGAVALEISTFHPSWVPLLVFQSKLVASSVPFWGWPCLLLP